MPDTEEDIQKTIELKKSVVSGEYSLKNIDIPVLNAQLASNASSSYASILKNGQPHSKSPAKSLFTTKITSPIVTIPKVVSPPLKKRKVIQNKQKRENSASSTCILSLEELQQIKHKERTDEQKARYKKLMKDRKKESISEEQKEEDRIRAKKRMQDVRNIQSEEEKTEETAKNTKRMRDVRSIQTEQEKKKETANNTKSKQIKRNIKTDSDLKRLLKFKNSVRFGAIFVCSCCHQQMFKNGVSILTEDIKRKLKEKDPALYAKFFKTDLILVEITEHMD